MTTLLYDLRFACRLLWKQKTLSFAAIATLAVCIGSATAVFSIVYGVVLRPLPFQQPDGLVVLHNSYPRAGAAVSGASIPDYHDFLLERDLFEEVALFRARGQTIGAGGTVERRTMLTMTPSLFRALGVQAFIGRVFTEDDGQLGNEHKIILGYELWQELAGGSRDVLGRDVRVNEVPYAVVGVMPAGFRFWAPDVVAWIPAAFTAEERSDGARHSNGQQVVARLKPGVNLDLLRQRIDALARRDLERLPALKPVLVNAGYRILAVPLQEFLVRDVRPTLYLLWGGSVFVLLIGVVNIANLALVRASGRTKEMAIRAALGAGIGQLARQSLTEAAVVAAIGGVLGGVLGRWGLALVRALGLERLPRAHEIGFDTSIVLYTLALVAGVSVVVGLVPLASLRWRTLGRAVGDEGRSGTASRRAGRVRGALVVAQIALALVLLAGAALLFGSFRRVLAEDPGFDVEDVWTGVVNLPSGRYAEDPRVLAFQARLLEAVRALPGVVAAGLTDTIPFGPGGGDGVLFAEGHVPKPGESVITAAQTCITPGYFEAMKIRLVRGRFFEDRDTATSRRVIIIDDRMARRFWPDADPIGKRMWQPTSADLRPPTDDAQFLTVAGVVRTVRVGSLSGEGERLGAAYFPMTQAPRRTLTVAARSTVAPSALTGTIRAEVQRLDRELPLANVRTMVERRDQVTETRRTPLVLSVAFGAIALFLSAIGLYGVLAYQVAQRRREIAIRMALGGRASDITWLVLRGGLLMIAAGSLLGLGGILAVGRLLESQLFGVRSSDPLIIAAMLFVVAFVATGACLLPARRAAAIDPAKALNDL